MMSLCMILPHCNMHAYMQVDEGLAGECDSEAMVVMRSIMQKQWFPHRLRSCSTEEVCSGLGQ